MIDAHLEKISDDIRSGVPVDIADAIAAIDYQETKRAAKESWWRRFYNFVMAALSGKEG